MPSWAYFLSEQALVFYVVIGCFLRPGAHRKARREWEEDHPGLSWEDWDNR